MHIFAHHLWEFYDEADGLNFFNMQGAEKLNDLITSYYFRCSNRDSNKSLSQVLQKRNRIEYFSLKKID
jgi:hypothetical protein